MKLFKNVTIVKSCKSLIIITLTFFAILSGGYAVACISAANCPENPVHCPKSHGFFSSVTTKACPNTKSKAFCESHFVKMSGCCKKTFHQCMFTTAGKCIENTTTPCHRG